MTRSPVHRRCRPSQPDTSPSARRPPISCEIVPPPLRVGVALHNGSPIQNVLSRLALAVSLFHRLCELGLFRTSVRYVHTTTRPHRRGAGRLRRVPVTERIVGGETCSERIAEWIAGSGG